MKAGGPSNGGGQGVTGGAVTGGAGPAAARRAGGSLDAGNMNGGRSFDNEECVIPTLCVSTAAMVSAPQHTHTHTHTHISTDVSFAQEGKRKQIMMFSPTSPPILFQVKNAELSDVLLMVTALDTLHGGRQRAGATGTVVRVVGTSGSTRTCPSPSGGESGTV